jgi:dTDP-4-amino-4,6-dideoxygalactose transaminase
MDDILELARSRNIRVIEDCAQAFLASYRGKHVGTFGDVNAFSLQQGKHITTGEGGIVTTNDDELAHRIYLFINKGWGYGDPKPDHDFIALNYRMNELTGAVANAQLDKLAPVVERRIERANRLTASLRGLAGISTPHIPDGSTHVYWKYTIRVDKDVIPGGPVAIAALLKEHNIFAVPRYIQKPAFRCAIFAERRTFGKSQWPFTLARPEALAYDDAHFPGTLAGLEQVLVLPWNEHFTNEHVDFISTSLRGAAERLAGGSK